MFSSGRAKTIRIRQRILRKYSEVKKKTLLYQTWKSTGIFKYVSLRDTVPIMRKRKGLFFFLKRLVTILSLARPPGTLKASYTRLTAFIKVKSSQRSTCGTSPAYPLRDSWHISKAFTGTFHFSRLVVMVLTSSHDSYPAFFLSFSTVHLQIGFGLPLLLFSTGAQVMAALQSLFWSCIIVYIRSSLIYAVSPLNSKVSCPLFLVALQY